MPRFLPGAVLAIALAPAGCGQPAPPIVPVEGVVLLDGKPLPNAQVQFVPMIHGFGAEYIAVGTTDGQGRFKLTCNGQDGACACENRVTVAEVPLPEEFRGQSEKAQAAAARFYAAMTNRPIPPKYGNLAQSDLKVEVKKGRTECRLELKR
jgi:hypothetical protein